MTATTYTQLPATKPGVSFGGWLSRLFSRMIAAREHSVSHRVAKIIRTYDNAHLKEFGYTSAEIARLRQGNRVH